MRRYTKEYSVKLDDGQEYHGTVKDFTMLLGLNYNTTMKRLYLGWTIEQALGIMPPPERKIIRVPASPEKIQSSIIERKVPRRKNSEIVFYRCTSSGGYYDYARKEG